MKTKHKLSLLLLAALVCVLFPTLAAAQGGKITYTYAVSDAELSLYKVGERNAAGGFELSGQFTAYSVDLTDSEAARTLYAYAKRDSVSPLAESKTDSEKTVVFDGLDAGVYLIAGESAAFGNSMYTPQPVLAVIDSGTDKLINGKYEITTVSTPSSGGGGGGGGGTVRYNNKTVSALKVWSGDVAKTPVTVQLLKNGEVYDEAELNEGNSWRCTWTNLNSRQDWDVVEKTVPSGCKVSIEKDGEVYVITNYDENKKEDATADETTEAESSVYETTKEENTEEGTVSLRDGEIDTDNPEGHPSASGDGTGDSDEPDVTDEDTVPDDREYDDSGSLTGDGDRYNSDRDRDGSSPDEGGSTGGSKKSSSNGKLPQTGLPWLPVIFLSCFGALFLIIGMGFKRKGE